MADPTIDNQPARTKADIARENGAKSRGPITPEGKARSSVNSFKHGLTAKCVVLSNESEESYTELQQCFRNTWQPIN